MLEWLAKTWNAVDLWITQQAFWLQYVILLAVLLPLCLAVAWLIDRVVDYLWAKFGRDQDRLTDRAASTETSKVDR